MIDWAKVETMTPEEIENIRVASMKELQAMQENYQIVKTENLCLSKQIAELRAQQAHLRVGISQAVHNISRKKSDIELLTAKFWQARR